MKRVLDLLRDPLIFSLLLALPFVAFLVAMSYVLYLHKVPVHVTTLLLVFLSSAFAAFAAKSHNRLMSRLERRTHE